MFQKIVYRTDLIADPDVLAAVDAESAVKVARLPGITQGRLGGYVDRVVARADRDAVRRRRERRGDREFSIWGDADGLTEVLGRLITTDAHAVGPGWTPSLPRCAQTTHTCFESQMPLPPSPLASHIGGRRADCERSG